MKPKRVDLASNPKALPPAELCQPWTVADPASKTPVCVLGLGLIGGSIMRAAAAAGREVFGYNRSVEGAQGAVADGFDATTELTDTLTRAADTDALIVLAVPMPAVPGMLAHISELAPLCPLTDVTSVKSAVLDEVAAAGLRDRFVGGHPMTGTETLGLGRRPRRVVHQGAVGGQRRRSCGSRRCGRW